MALFGLFHVQNAEDFHIRQMVWCPSPMVSAFFRWQIFSATVGMSLLGTTCEFALQQATGLARNLTAVVSSSVCSSCNYNNPKMLPKFKRPFSFLWTVFMFICFLGVCPEWQACNASLLPMKLSCQCNVARLATLRWRRLLSRSRPKKGKTTAGGKALSSYCCTGWNQNHFKTSSVNSTCMLWISELSVFICCIFFRCQWMSQ